jgi:hypothetical protein
MTRFKIPKTCFNWSLKRISEAYGCSVPTACKLRMRLGNTRKKVDWSKIDWHKSSTSEIAKKLGRRMNAVSRKRAYYAPETLVKFKRK